MPQNQQSTTQAALDSIYNIDIDDIAGVIDIIGIMPPKSLKKPPRGSKDAPQSPKRSPRGLKRHSLTSERQSYHMYS